MVDVIVDTDVFVDHLRGAHRLSVDGLAVLYSVITRAELFAGRASEEARVSQLLDAFVELVVNRAIAEQAGRLRRALSIRVPDALIAATALVHGLELVTRNLRDFESVPGLTIRAPISH